MAVDAEQVAAFLGKPGDAATEALAETAVPVVTAMARAYVRGGTDWEPNDEIDAVIVTATARVVANPTGLSHDMTAGPFTHSIRGAFQGWSLAELFVLNRYRKRAL